MTVWHACRVRTADVALARALAEQVGERLLRLRETEPLEAEELGAAGDALANQLLVDRLAAERPADAVLSEESEDDPARLTARRVWIVDPLDGTREFTQGNAEWAVHIALWEADVGITAAAVALPALGEVHSSADGPAATEPTTNRLVVSASRPPSGSERAAAALGAELVPMGSAGAKAMAVLRGEADGYLHAGGQWEWDSAAPVGVVTAAGLHASRLDGSPLRYNRADPYLPDLLICRPELADRLLAAISAELEDSD